MNKSNRLLLNWLQSSACGYARAHVVMIERMAPIYLFIYLFIYLTLPINIYKENTQKHIWTIGRKHATAFAIYSGPYRKIRQTVNSDIRYIDLN